MRMNTLGSSSLAVSELCLGTMTFGAQTPQEEAHRQLDLALDHGINFMDTAEMYPVNPVRAETIGRTEEIIGNWVAATGKRDQYVIATKHTGEGLKIVRDGAPISAKTIAATIEGSLKRLQVETIDLYQFHWPNRGSYAFRKNWTYDPSGQDREETLENMLECLEALQEQVNAGKIRYFGLSNESAWGTAQWLHLARTHNLPKVQSIQNEYSLLYRAADTDLAELMCNEDVGLLPYSSLAAGILTGKYRGGAIPDGSRASVNSDLNGRITPRSLDATEAYAALAQEHGTTLINLAYAWTAQRPFVGSVIIGATRLAQLEEILNTYQPQAITPELRRAVDRIQRQHPWPF